MRADTFYIKEIIVEIKLYKTDIKINQVNFS